MYLHKNKKMAKKEQRKVKTGVIITGMACITILEIVAMLKGIDGVLLTTVIGALCLLSGIMLPTPKALV
jgi:hypothetical protein